MARKSPNEFIHHDKGYDYRQTYRGRNYPGTEGPYFEEAKILTRIDEEEAIDQEFIKNLEEDINSLAAEIDFKNKELLDYGVDVIKKALVKYTPVDTGELVNNWVVTPDYDEGTIEIYNKLDYANAIEYGKYGMANGIAKNVFYPGYYMAERSFHEGTIKMQEKGRQMIRELESGR